MENEDTWMKVDDGCWNCKSWVRYETPTTSHVKYYGTCQKIESMRSDPEALYATVAPLICNSRVLTNQSFMCINYEANKGKDE